MMSGLTGVSGAAQAKEMTGASAVKESQASQAAQETKEVQVRGKTIGNPKLSEKAASYYEELKKKFSNMDFILVSADQKEAAKARAASFANPNKMVVLIDEDKIERMAEDENFRKQYEGIIRNGASSLSQMAKKITASGAKVKGFGMQVKDGRASFFAAVDKSFSTMRKRQEKRIADKKAAEKTEEKKAAKKAAEERVQNRRDKTGEEDAEKVDLSESRWDTEDVEILSASSIEELMRKIEDYNYAGMSDRARTEQERRVGQQFDFSV